MKPETRDALKRAVQHLNEALVARSTLPNQETDCECSVCEHMREARTNIQQALERESSSEGPPARPEKPAVFAHDDCTNCKYSLVELHEEPCRTCAGRAWSKWEPKP